jgi:hypothetical protein
MAGTTQTGKAEAGVETATAEAAIARADAIPRRGFLMIILLTAHQAPIRTWSVPALLSL